MNMGSVYLIQNVGAMNGIFYIVWSNDYMNILCVIKTFEPF